MRLLLDECLPRGLLEGIGVAVIALKARSNRADDLRPLMPRVLEVLAGMPRPGSLTREGD